MRAHLVLTAGVTEPTDVLARLRTDVVGSLLRPDPLKRAWEDYLAGRIDEPARTAVEDAAAAADVLAEQEARGLPLVTDGEFRRLNYMDSFTDVAGMASWQARWVETLAEFNRTGEAGRRGGDPSLAMRQEVTEPLRLVRNRPLDEFAFLAERATAVPTVTVLGPDRVIQGVALEESGAVYRDADELAAGVVGALTDMVRGLAEAGCRYVHLDEPGFTSYVDDAALAAIRARGDDPAELLQRSIDAVNALVVAFPDVVFGVHVCRGNRRSQWHREGHYDAVAEQLFGGLRAQRLLLEYDTERAGGFGPLRYVRPDTVAVLGLITTKSGEPEPVDDLLRRVEDASAHLPVEQLSLSPQCGFASAFEGNLLTVDDQWRKLELMLEVAARVWP